MKYKLNLREKKYQFKWKTLSILVINYSEHLCYFKQEKIKIINSIL